MEHPYWNAHYRTFKLQQPSSFSRYCATQHLRPSDVLVELGCGNGRDGLMLLQHVSRYVGVDICSAAMDAFAGCTGMHRQSGQPEPNLLRTDFTSIDFNEFCSEDRRLAVYSRFTLHAITYAEQARLFDHLAAIRRSRWVFMVEARTIDDDLYGQGRKVGPHEYETDHYRRFIDPSAFLRDVSSRFTVRYFQVSDGFAVYGCENPVLMRAVIEGGDVVSTQ